MISIFLHEEILPHFDIIDFKELENIPIKKVAFTFFLMKILVFLKDTV